MSLFTKTNVNFHEYKIHKYIYDLKIVNCPEIISYDIKSKIMVMKNINNMCISDYYGENPENIPDYIFIEIKKIIKVLHDNKINYPDITGYNFIEHNDKIWIIDFEHSSIIKEDNDKFDKFVLSFLKDNKKIWNPIFK